MRRSELSTVVLLAALCVGCTDAGYAPHPIFIAVAEPVSVGVYGDAELVNASGAAVVIGPIGCYVRTDKLINGNWSELPRENPLCGEPLYIVPSGSRFAFTFSPPTASGTYRLRTGVANDTVLSASFTVR